MATTLISQQRFECYVADLMDAKHRAMCIFYEQYDCELCMHSNVTLNVTVKRHLTVYIVHKGHTILLRLESEL